MKLGVDDPGFYTLGVNHSTPTTSRFKRVRRLAIIAATLSLSGIGGWRGQSGTNTPLDTPENTTQSTIQSVSRPAKNAVVITLTGAIDRWTARSVERRIKEAEEAGADAIVIELNTPGGEVGATLQISNAIKGSSITNSVAWVHPDAYSGGAIVALACSRVVVGDPAAIGDAFQIIPPTFNEQLGGAGIRAPTAVERTKILSVIMRDVVDSARRNGQDELLVQAMAIDGIELWLVERGQTGEFVAINEQEYLLIFGTTPPRGMPELSGVIGGRYAATGEGPVEQTHEPISIPIEGPMPEPDQTDPEEDQFGYIPASENLRDVQAEMNNPERTDLVLEIPSKRPNFVAMSVSDDPQAIAELASYRLAGYLCDGTAAVILRTEDSVRYGVARQVINTDEELAAFFGGATLARERMNGFEHFARFLSSWPVKTVLIALLLLGFAIDLLSPGLVVPTVVWLGALVALMAPPMIVGMAGWWEVLAILIGLASLGAEIFVLPGFGLFGVIGIMALFAGLVGTFMPNGPTFEGAPTDMDGLVLGVISVMLSVVTASIGMYFMSKRFETFPVLNRLILSTVSGQERESSERDAMLSAMREPTRDLIAVGDEGTASTVLRPSGNALIHDTLVDVVSDLGYIEKGETVRVVRVDGMTVRVQRIENESESNSGEQAADQASDQSGAPHKPQGGAEA